MAEGLFRELNPGPLAPEARIMPLDQTASCANAWGCFMLQQFEATYCPYRQEKSLRLENGITLVSYCFLRTKHSRWDSNPQSPP